MKHPDETYTGNTDPYLHLSSAQASDDGTLATHWLYNKSARTLRRLTVDGAVVASELRPGCAVEFTTVSPIPTGHASFAIVFDVVLPRRRWWRR